MISPDWNDISNMYQNCENGNYILHLYEIILLANQLVIQVSLASFYEIKQTLYSMSTQIMVVILY